MNACHYDEIIVGQGLAGTALAWCLRWRGRRVLVIDRENRVTSSRIAAGLITPITGQRVAKSWHWDQFWAAAIAYYGQVEAETESKVFRKTKMVRLLANDREREYFARRLPSEFEGLVVQSEPLVNPDWFQSPAGGFEMIEAGRLEVLVYLDASRQRFARDGQYTVGDVSAEWDITLTSSGAELPRLGLSSQRIIFCQGFDAVSNPFFSGVRFNLAKGEILTVRIEGLAEERIIHRGIWLMPLGGNLFRVGATYDWSQLDCEPTSEGRDEICARLREFLRLPFEVVGHDAAVRPILSHQNPAIGLHPRHRQIGFFNGLGSKEALQAPWLAGHFAGYLAGEHPLDLELDLQRYDERYRMTSLTELAHSLIRSVLRPGDVAVDATVGNGHDTLFLAECVGPQGIVYGFDIQPEALAGAMQRVNASGLQNVILFHRSHAELETALRESPLNAVRAVMFNLGYLPGGNKHLTTQARSTTAAIEAGLKLLAPGGIVTILAYVGHTGGSEEATAVAALLNKLPARDFDTHEKSLPEKRIATPRLFVVRKRG